MGLYTLVILLALCGLGISTYIRSKKKKAQPMVCPMKGNCHAVTSSKFSKFLGMPVELLGISYYAALAMGYGIVLALPSVHQLAYILLAITTGGFLFSLYLTFIQVVTLRQLCTWCLASAAITTAIFSLSLSGSVDTVVPFLLNFEPLLVVMTLSGLAVGIGAATISDTLFLRFLRDFRISDVESEIIQTTFQVIWLALAVCLIGEFGLYLLDTTAALASPMFLTKLAVYSVMILSGWFLNLKIAPKLVDITFRKKHKHHKGELHDMRRWAFGLGSLWVVSWYYILGLTVIPLERHTLLELLTIYVLLLLIGLTVSQLIERSLIRKANRNLT